MNISDNVETKKVEKRGDKYCVVHCGGKDDGKVIKCFDSREKAEKMHAAIQANKNKGKSYEFYCTDNFDYEEVETKAGKEYYITGYISTHDRDLVDDIVTPACMSDMLTQLKNRSIKLDIEHESFRGKSTTETEINKTTIPIGRIVEARQDERGIWIKGLLNKAHTRFDEVWGSIKSGMLDAFSIAYIPTQIAYKMMDNSKVRLLDALNLLNVALTGNPVNPSATMGRVFAKSLYDMEDDNQEGDTGDESKAKDGRPPKAWWDNCMRRARKFASDPEKLCGALYHNPEKFPGGGGKMRSAFGKSGDFLIDKEEEEQSDMTDKDEQKNLEVKGDSKVENEKKDSIDVSTLSSSVDEMKESLKAITEKLEKIEEKKAKETDDEHGSGKVATPEELKAELDELRKLKKELEEIKAFMNEPQYKAVTEGMKAALEKNTAEKKGMTGPLDKVR